MKIAEKCKVFAIGALVAALAAGTAVPALAVSITGYTPVAAVEAQNDVDQSKVQAIRDALERIDIGYDESDGAWVLDSMYLESKTDEGKSFIMPWLLVDDNSQNVTFVLEAISQNNEAFYYWNNIDILYGEYENYKSIASFRINTVQRSYNAETQRYSESASFVVNTGLERMGQILSNDLAYVRFNGAKVNGTQRMGAFLIDDENRQGITDIINLYNALMDATPEERTAALQE